MLITIKDPTHPFCPHCDTIPNGQNGQCCTGWCQSGTKLSDV